ncbi:MAG: hypothetical protein J5892_05100 [Bacilli bacterium]|nr:hypothetical protein [Bacilli bacterium]
MHRYLLRLKDVLFQRIKVESDSRGISINDMINELIEIGLLKIYEEEGKHGKIKPKQINS